MLLPVLLIATGILLLYLGAQSLVRGASSLALKYAVRPGIIGLTVVALGTSMPEFLVNALAVFSGKQPLALGNVIGSNITNVALILGVTTVLVPITMSERVLRRDYPVMLGVMGLFYVCALDGTIGRLDGLFMVVLLVGLWSSLLYSTARRPVTPIIDEVTEEGLPTEMELSTSKMLGLVVAGIVGLGLGAYALVEGATVIAASFGMHPVVVGLTIVAVGTSLPELAASLVSTLQEKPNLSVGNLLGSNVLNVLLVVGAIAVVDPMEVDRTSLQIDIPVMLGLSGLVVPLAWPDGQMGRGAGSILLLCFLAYMGYLLAPYF